MTLIQADHLTKAYGETILFENLCFQVQENDKIGLIGANGAGKTTLFQILAGKISADSGNLHCSKSLKTGYMEQHLHVQKQNTVWEEMESAFSGLKRMEMRIDQINDQLLHISKDQHTLIEEQLLLQSRFEALGGLYYKSQVDAMLLGLGFEKSCWDQAAASLSGGQLSKLSLGKMLLSDSNLLLLDEPTNHLDISSAEWLETYLKNIRSACIIISHDRYFLDAITTRTFELAHRKLLTAAGNYSMHLKKKEEAEYSLKKQYDNTRKEIKRLEGIVEQQRRWNRERNIKTAESKLKVIEKLESTLVKPEKEQKQLCFRFSVPDAGGSMILSVSNLSMGFGDKLLYRDVSFQITQGDRIFLLGPNGCGKTTLFQNLLQKIPPLSGTIKLGTSVQTAYYDQTQSTLNDEQTVLSEVWNAASKMSQTEIRSALATFLFSGDDVNKRIGSLSGGERARVSLLKLMLSKANFLMLDEPTNHLDIPSRGALEQALLQYEGTLLIISHDRYFINRLASKIIILKESGVTEYIGNYDRYAEKANTNQTISQAAAGLKPSFQNDYKKRKADESEARKRKTAFARTEARIAELEEKIRFLHIELNDPKKASNYLEISALHNLLTEYGQEHDRLTEQWLLLSEQLESS